MYDLTNLTNATDFYDVTLSINQLSSYGSFPVFGIIIMVLVFLLTFIMFKKTQDDARTVFVVSSTLTVFLSLMLWGFKFIGSNILFYPIGLFIASILVYFFSDR